MGKPLDFSGPYLKTERAKHHIRQLEGVFRTHLRENKKALSPNRYRQMRERGPPIGTAFPKHTPTILGDALHNLRASLDHAYCALIEANGHTVHERSFFPIVNPGGKDSWQSRKASMQGHEKTGFGPGLHMIDVLFNEVQPYDGGNGEALVKLHVLDIADKHMVLLPTEQHTRVENVRFEGGGGISGITFVTSGAPAIAFGPGARLEQSHNNKATFDICFGRGQPYEGEPILPVLWGLKGRVDDTLQLLEQRAKIIP